MRITGGIMKHEYKWTIMVGQREGRRRTFVKSLRDGCTGLWSEWSL